jgi:hypothetical protein
MEAAGNAASRRVIVNAVDTIGIDNSLIITNNG